MLYLVKTNGAYKVGYTKFNKRQFKTSSRWKAYTSSNPFIELVDMRSGNRKDEAKLHERMERIGFQQVNNTEWYLCTDLYRALVIDEKGFDGLKLNI